MASRVRAPWRSAEQGFSLVELLVVVIIIGILAAIAIPLFLNQRSKAYDATAQSDLKNLATAEEAYLADSGSSAYWSSAPSQPPGQVNGPLFAHGFRETSNVISAVYGDGSNGFCAVATSTDGRYFWYDSRAGGLQPDPSGSFTLPSTPSCTGSGLTPSSLG